MITSNSLKTSTYVYNSSEAKRKYRNWVETFPWIKPHYAIKSNPSLPLLQDLINEGSNFDCASKSELELLLNLGVNASKLVYSNPVKEEFDLEWAEKNNVQLTTADTIEELIKIKKYAPQMNILWRISIKEEASDNLSTPFSGKFGDDIATVE
jgi:diaminopimelate decarboxylase